MIVVTLLVSCQSNSPKTESLQEAPPPAAEITAVNNGDVEFDTYFLGKTMRMDFFHTGKTGEESFAVDRVVSDGEWGGSKKILIDRLELGPYFFEVIDKNTNVLLYSRGFASIFGE